MGTEVPYLQLFYLEVFNFMMAPDFNIPVRIFPQASDLSLSVHWAEKPQLRVVPTVTVSGEATSCRVVLLG